MNTVAPIESPSPFTPSLAALVGRWLLLFAFLLLSVPTLRAQLTYTAENGAITITGYKGTTAQVIIPETIDGLPVRAIGNSAFDSRLDIYFVSIPDSVKGIGGYAFNRCSMTSVSIGKNVTSIGGSAFAGCTGLTSLTIPNSVTAIGDLAFYQCTGLTSLSIGNVTSLGNYTFAGCTGLTSLTIPNSVTYIGDHTFADCTGLTSLKMPSSLLSIGDYSFSRCSGLTNLDSASIGKSVTSIGNYAFFGCARLTSLSIPDSVTAIGDQAFSGCTGLTSLSIGNRVNYIGSFAFIGCTGLTRLSIPTSVTYIGSYAFYACRGLTAVIFKGNQPLSGTFDEPTTLYYLPGTAGWGGSYAGRPSLLWNPSAPTQDPAFGVRNGKFGFKITGTANIPVVVEACDSLTEPVWLPLATITLTSGSSLFSDPDWASHPSRVYRFRSP